MMSNDPMQLARKMVGINEQSMAREEAEAVFVRHGGGHDRDFAPILGQCQRCHSGLETCSIQRLAFAVLLMDSTFRVSEDMIVDKVLEKIGAIVRSQGGG